MSGKEERPRTESFTACELLPQFKSLWNKYCKNCGEEFDPEKLNCTLGHNVGFCGCFYRESSECFYKSATVEIRIFGRDGTRFGDYGYYYDVKLNGVVVYHAEKR